MKDGYFDSRDLKSVRKCLRKWDQYIVARPPSGLKGHERPDPKEGLHPERAGREGYNEYGDLTPLHYRLFSCPDLQEAIDYVKKNGLYDVNIFQVDDIKAEVVERGRDLVELDDVEED